MNKQNKSDCIGIFCLRTSGSIASGDLKLGLGRYGVVSAFGRKEIENFSFTPSLVGSYQEAIIVQNVLDPYNDQNVAVKANVRKQPAFTVEPACLNFGTIDVSDKLARSLSFALSNVSKHERTFSVEVHVEEIHALAEVSLTRGDKEVGTALSKVEEEELEGLLQKLKIARRKGKADKIGKYESRLVELGVSVGSGAESDAESTDDGPSTVGTPISEEPTPIKAAVSSLSVTLQPSMKNKILVELLPRSGQQGPLKATIKVHDRKNTDETLSVSVIASSSALNNTTSASILALSSASSSKSSSSSSGASRNSRITSLS